jgi:hypothetical protein
VGNGKKPAHWAELCAKHVLPFAKQCECLRKLVAKSPSRLTYNFWLSTFCKETKVSPTVVGIKKGYHILWLVRNVLLAKPCCIEDKPSKDKIPHKVDP